MTLQPPFTLFVTATDIDDKYINDGLTRAWKGNFEASWNLWVATNNFDNAPKTREDNKPPEATKPPLSDSFKSPWAGKSLEDCAKWLRSAPSDVAVHKQYFTAMNEYSKEDDTVLVCRIVESKTGGEFDLEYFPESTDTIVMSMWTNDSLKFDEKAQNYQRARMRDGKPDRSKAGPYQ